jgi:hypothetical protein
MEYQMSQEADPKWDVPDKRPISPKEKEELSEIETMYGVSVMIHPMGTRRGNAPWSHCQYFYALRPQYRLVLLHGSFGWMASVETTFGFNLMLTNTDSSSPKEALKDLIFRIKYARQQEEAKHQTLLDLLNVQPKESVHMLKWTSLSDDPAHPTYPTEPPTDGWGHPGIRVGQTWRMSTGSAFTITDFEPDEDGNGKFGPAWFIGSHWIPDSELRNLLRHDDSYPEHSYALLVDAACPWFAPWDSRWPALGPTPPYRLEGTPDARFRSLRTPYKTHWNVWVGQGDQEVYLGGIVRQGGLAIPLTCAGERICPVPVYEPRAVAMIHWWSQH